ncbi:hypothetical protein [Niallia sp.]|uniref:hypothetical protein n=1 Tax=Niallia sp. TaxID=2837523 RepID=UPI00289F0AF1|nr:hypothetical protein [Niallia sp.]
MKKAVVFGAYQFLGFHICGALLDEGEEIIGVSFPNMDVNDIEDKRMEIGRNANYSEISWNQVDSILRDPEIDCLFYDLYTVENLQSVYRMIRSQIFNRSKFPINKKLVFLVNIMSVEKERELFNSIKEELDNTTQIIHMPTLYGPWQPSDFLFQQVIEGKEQEAIHISFRECPMDAIFIEDAVMAVVKQTNIGQNNDILLKSNVINHWQRCLEHLKWDIPKTIKKDVEYSGRLEEVMVINKCSISENLDKQKKHHLLYRI